MLTWSLQLFALQHRWRVSLDSWSQWQYFRNPMFGVKHLQNKRQCVIPSHTCHVTSPDSPKCSSGLEICGQIRRFLFEPHHHRTARSRKKQRKPERDWRIECAQLLLTISACAKNTWHMAQMRGNSVFNIMIMMNSATMLNSGYEETNQNWEGYTLLHSIKLTACP